MYLLGLWIWFDDINNTKHVLVYNHWILVRRKWANSINLIYLPLIIIFLPRALPHITHSTQIPKNIVVSTAGRFSQSTFTLTNKFSRFTDPMDPAQPSTPAKITPTSHNSQATIPTREGNGKPISQTLGISQNIIVTVVWINHTNG